MRKECNEKQWIIKVMTHQEGIKYRDVKEKERESERGENLKLNILLFSKFSAHLPKMTSLRMYSIKKKTSAKSLKRKLPTRKTKKSLPTLNS